MSATRSRPAIFLDRDGVLNEAFVRDGVPTPPRSLAEFRVLPGAAEACADLRRAGFVLVVVTNQPDIARGRQTRAEVDRIHERLRSLVPLDEVCVCPHDDCDACTCRKPQPGMLLDAAKRLDLDLARSVSVGDRWRDIEAAQRAGVTAIHVACHYAEPAPVGADVTVANLPEAVAWIQQQREPGRGAAWTEERGTSDEGRRRLTAARRASGEQSTSDEGRRRSEGGMGRRAGPRRRAEQQSWGTGGPQG